MWAQCIFSSIDRVLLVVIFLIHFTNRGRLNFIVKQATISVSAIKFVAVIVLNLFGLLWHFLVFFLDILDTIIEWFHFISKHLLLLLNTFTFFKLVHRFLGHFAQFRILLIQLFNFGLPRCIELLQLFSHLWILLFQFLDVLFWIIHHIRQFTFMVLGKFGSHFWILFSQLFQIFFEIAFLKCFSIEFLRHFFEFFLIFLCGSLGFFEGLLAFFFGPCEELSGVVSEPDDGLVNRVIFNLIG